MVLDFAPLPPESADPWLSGSGASHGLKRPHSFYENRRIFRRYFNSRPEQFGAQ